MFYPAIILMENLKLMTNRLTESGVTQTVSKRNELLNEEDFDNEDDLLLPEWRKNNYSSEKV